MTKTNLNLESGKAVAFDFDGVIHKYSEGWKDGSIYDEPNMEILNLILLLQLANIPCVIISTREPNQIKEWWDKQGFTIMAKPLCFETRFFNDCTYVGITNRKIPAQLYIDDRAYRYTGQTAKEFLIDCLKNETGQAESEEVEQKLIYEKIKNMGTREILKVMDNHHRGE